MVNEFEVKAGAVPFLSDFTPFSYSGALPVTVDGAIVSFADVTQKEGPKLLTTHTTGNYWIQDNQQATTKTDVCDA